MTKLRAWEEEWTLTTDETAICATLTDDNKQILMPAVLQALKSSSPLAVDGRSARARLAAQAPAMARMLLEMSEVVIQDGPCPICGWFEESYHAPDCKLIALLKNAGVIE